MTVTEHPEAIVTRLRVEASIADRPGLVDRLEAEADAIQALIDEYAKLCAVLGLADKH